jgi:hypothetical protein
MMLTTITLAVIWYYAMDELLASIRRAKRNASNRAMALWHAHITLARVIKDNPKDIAVYVPVPTLPPSYAQLPPIHVTNATSTPIPMYVPE